LKRGRAGTLTHDYKRHGTTTLFAALNTLDGSVIARCDNRHRHHEWLTFLRQIDRETPKGKALHLICDNYATHKHPKVREWLEKHPRFHVHFTPTSASWLMVGVSVGSRQRTDQIPIDPTVSILAYDDASGLLLAVDASPPATRPLLHKVHRVGRA